jgi:GTP-binding protein HflX
VRLPDARQILLSDTVGFIDRLPHQLVASFHATLEEVVGADILLHVIDASASDRGRRADAVSGVLAEVGAGRVPVIEVFNKIDRLGADELSALRAAHPDAAFVSAADGTGRGALLERVARRLSMDAERVHLALDSSVDADRQLLADLYRHARGVSHVASDEHVSIEADIPRRLLNRFARATVHA